MGGKEKRMTTEQKKLIKKHNKEMEFIKAASVSTGLSMHTIWWAATVGIIGVWGHNTKKRKIN